MSAADDLKIFMNILAQSPNGLSDPDLIGKFTKSKAMLHAMDSMTAMQAQMPPPPIAPPQNIAPVTPNEPLGATISDQTAQSTTPIPPMQNG